MLLAERLRHRILDTPELLAAARRILPGLDIRLLRMSGGRLSLTPRGARVLVLTTIGRRSGSARATPVLYTRDGDTFVVVASNWGAPRPPHWLLNLRAHPAATVHIGRSQHAVTATELAGAERDTVWTRLVRSWPLYTDLAAHAGTRQLPVIRLSIVHTG